MRGKFLIYGIVLVMFSSLMSWGSMFSRAGGRVGSGGSWGSSSSGGYSSGGWSSGGGHK